MPYIPIAKARGFTAGFGKRKHYYISKYIPRNFLTHNKIHAKTRAHKCFRNYFCKKQSHGIEYCSFVLGL